jgi:hypothetical protein
MMVNGVPGRQEGSSLLQQLSLGRERPADWGPARVAPLAGLLDYLHVGPTVQNEGLE